AHDAVGAQQGAGREVRTRRRRRSNVDGAIHECRAGLGIGGTQQGFDFRAQGGVAGAFVLQKGGLLRRRQDARLVKQALDALPVFLVWIVQAFPEKLSPSHSSRKPAFRKVLRARRGEKALVGGEREGDSEALFGVVGERAP